MKKVYNISGFDCANCAAKTESYLNHNENIEYARIDFAGNRLYITYKDKELSIDEIKSLIKQVESADIFVSDINTEVKKERFLNKKTIILLARIVITTILIFSARFAVSQDSYVALGLLVITFFIK